MDRTSHTIGYEKISDGNIVLILLQTIETLHITDPSDQDIGNSFSLAKFLASRSFAERVAIILELAFRIASRKERIRELQQAIIKSEVEYCKEKELWEMCLEEKQQELNKLKEEYKNQENQWNKELTELKASALNRFCELLNHFDLPLVTVKALKRVGLVRISQLLPLGWVKFNQTKGLNCKHKQEVKELMRKLQCEHFLSS